MSGEHRIEIILPENTKVGDITTVIGALMKASTEFVNWERLYDSGNDRGGGPAAISTPGRILLDIAQQLSKP